MVYRRDDVAAKRLQKKGVPLDPAVVGRVEAMERRHATSLERASQRMSRMAKEITQVRQECTCGAAQRAQRETAGGLGMDSE